MEISEIIIYFALSALAILFLVLTYKFLFTPTEADKEYDRKLKESLADEYIIDPETGAKLTLEQAESGHWINHDNEYNTTPESEIEKLYSEEAKNAERAVNYLKEKREYKKYQFDESQILILEKTKTLSKYDEWTYSDCFRIEYTNGFVFLPAVLILDKLPGYFDTTYNESQLMFWIKLDENLGHYYFREKSKVEKIINLLKKGNELNLSNYETYIFKETSSLNKVNEILKEFEGTSGLEIEIMENNLFVKNLKLVNLNDIKRIESIVKNVC